MWWAVYCIFRKVFWKILRFIVYYPEWCRLYKCEFQSYFPYIFHKFYKFHKFIDFQWICGICEMIILRKPQQFEQASHNYGEQCFVLSKKCFERVFAAVYISESDFVHKSMSSHGIFNNISTNSTNSLYFRGICGIVWKLPYCRHRSDLSRPRIVLVRIALYFSENLLKESPHHRLGPRVIYFIRIWVFHVVFIKISTNSTISTNSKISTNSFFHKTDESVSQHWS